MNIIHKLVLALVATTSTSTSTAAADDVNLPTRIVATDGWVSWQVPIVTGAGSPCCFSWRGKQAARNGCDLDGREWNFGNDGDAPVVTDEALAVYVHVAGGKVDKVRAVAASCPVRAGSTIRQLDNIDSDSSVAWISQRVTQSADTKDDDSGVAVLAYHAGTAATGALNALARSGNPREQRESSLFWLGQTRAEEGIRTVERYATTDADPELRQHAVFVLSQAETVDTYPRVLAIAGSDTSAEVRGQALFWLAQMKDARAEADIIAALQRESSEDVREQAVFALSQLEDGQGDRALIALVRGDHPRPVKQRALFWLGQSGSNEALTFMDEVLAKDRSQAAASQR